MTQTHFDYSIIGSGLAGLQLALAFSEDVFFADKQIALIDKSKKTENDKTWCFWEKGKGQWSEIVFKSWNKGRFISTKENVLLNLPPYSYKMIRALDFYDYAKKRLKAKSNFHFIQDEIQSVEGEKIIGKNGTYIATHHFDSRIPKTYFQNEKKHTPIFQHFKGWMIETDTPVFDTEEFTMMDYRLKWKNSTSFSYVLPISSTKAFVEYTFFTPFKVEDSVYDKMLKRYIAEFLHIKNYRITETEQGVIPMTDFPFEQFSTEIFTKIGTAGGWVKASSGYSFKKNSDKIAKLIANIKTGRNPSENLIDKKFRFYDKVFLSVLKHDNEMGEWIFEQFYSKNSPQEFFSFLDEESTRSGDFKIISSLFSMAFIRAFFRTIGAP